MGATCSCRGLVGCLALFLVSGCSSTRDGQPAASGELDAGFGAGGVVTTTFEVDAYGYTRAYAMALQDDGMIVAAGTARSSDGPEGEMEYLALARYRSDGGLDPDFGAGGTVMTTDGAGTAVAIQPDGKIVVAGFRGGEFLVARYDPDGTLDTVFGENGRVTTAFAGQAFANAVAIQADGKIVAAGEVLTNDGWAFALARYDEGGNLDPAFGTGGQVVNDFGGEARATGIAVQPDGKIVAAGYSWPDGERHVSFALARYDEDGGLDATFGTGGQVTTDVGAGEVDFANAVAIQSDGKIVAAGVSVSDPGLFQTSLYALARYGEDGSLDASFGTAGRVTTAVADGNDSASGVAIRADGKVVAVGTSDVDVGGHPQRRFSVARYEEDGTLDAAFGDAGTATTRIGASGDTNLEEGRAVAIQADGKIVTAGFSGGVFAVVRYEP